MRIAYTVVIALYLVVATVRLKLRESLKDAEKMNIREAIRSYPRALKEGVSVWKTMPRSTRFVFFSELIVRFSNSLTQVLLLVYAFNVLQIGGIPTLGLSAEIDPALQLARIRWGYVLTALFVCMIILSFPVGRLLDRIGRKKPLILSNLLIVPAILLFAFGNYWTLYIAMPLLGFSMLLGFSSYQTLFADLIPQAQRGKVMGSMNFFAYILMAIAGAAGGFLCDYMSPQLPFILTILRSFPRHS